MEGLRRIKLVLAYDGTNYCGWQVQPNGMSIQEMLQKHIEELTGEKIMLTGASRTDSGVHALGQVAVFDTTKIWPAERFVPALNQRLPKDIVIQSAEEVPMDFHPRYQNTLKTYEYRILNRRAIAERTAQQLFCASEPGFRGHAEGRTGNHRHPRFS